MKQFATITVSLVVVLFASTGIVSAQDITVDGRAAERDARIDKYRKNVTDRLSATDERRVAGVCKAAQNIVDRLQSNLDSVIEKRQQTYASVGDKLSSASDQLEAAGLDVTELNRLISQLQADAQAVITLARDYQQILTDLAALDCEADVEGFRAALGAARSARTELVTAARGLKAFVNDSIKPEVQSLREQLAAASEGV